MKMTGARVVIECLLEQGVDTVFGYPGGTILNIYDELYKYSDRITHYLTSHEQHAAHAADGYARSTGKVGVCMATSGPGATNLTTGIATAYMDSSPVVFICCNVGQKMLGKDAFQEVDITGITMPITKCNYLVRDVNKLADTIREAFGLARSGRPGPVLIDITKDVTAAEVDYEYLPREQHRVKGALGRLVERSRTSSLLLPEPDQGDIDILVDMIKESEKPMLICGGGVARSWAHKEFREFARKLDAPVAITVMGGGAMDGADPLTTGMIGMHGSQASNMAVDGCDLLIAVGCRFSDRVALKPDTFARNAKIVQIDIDRAEINKNVQTDHHIIGNAKDVLAKLNKAIPQYHHDEWKKYVFSFPTETKYDDDINGAMTPKQILSNMVDMLPDDTIVATDVGEHQMWAIQHFHFSYPGQLITSGGYGTMGFGLGAAIGAKVGNPDKTVIQITGDGSFRMNCAEMSTEEYYKLPIITFIFNNGVLGMVHQWQDLMYGKRFSQTILDRGPDFVKLANAYGLKGRRVENVDELRDAIAEALEEQKKGLGYVIDCAVATDEMVRPMVNGGTHITEFLLD
jgi:acetolactate synthase-1/2/3 large subunit